MDPTPRRPRSRTSRQPGLIPRSRIARSRDPPPHRRARQKRSGRRIGLVQRGHDSPGHPPPIRRPVNSPTAGCTVRDRCGAARLEASAPVGRRSGRRTRRHDCLVGEPPNAPHSPRTSRTIRPAPPVRGLGPRPRRRGQPCRRSNGPASVPRLDERPPDSRPRVPPRVLPPPHRPAAPSDGRTSVRRTQVPNLHFRSHDATLRRSHRHSVPCDDCSP